MDAIARFDFYGNGPSQLNFRKGDILKMNLKRYIEILNMVDDKYWWTAELNQRKGLIPSSYVQLKFLNWYRATTTRAEAEEILKTAPVGGFLVRDSETSTGEYSLSVKYPTKMNHFRIFRDVFGKFYLYIVKFNSVNDLVDFYRVNQLLTRDIHNVVLNDFFPKFVKVLCDYKARRKDEINLKTGDIVSVTNCSDMKWWTGCVGEQKGIFPASNVTTFHPALKFETS